MTSASRPAAARGRASYWRLSRAPRYSLLFALPLLVLYESLAALLGDGGSVRNGADVWLKAPFLALFGARGPTVFGALLVVGSAALVWRDVRRTRDGVRTSVLLRMFAESALLAVLCGLLVGLATSELVASLPHLLPNALASGDGAAAVARTRLGGPRTLMLALGAGLYEELLFRVVLVSALGFVARRFVGLGEAGAALFAVIGGALLFSAAHYIGPYGDPLTLPSFAFRAIAGLFFSGVYVLRGFGIAAWTHALYDVGVLFLVG